MMSLYFKIVIYNSPEIDCIRLPNYYLLSSECVQLIDIDTVFFATPLHTR